MSSKHHIIIGLSGGVDSAVAAYLLKKEGHHVEAIFMKNWEEDDTDTYCPASIDMADAQAVCDHLGIELHNVNFANEYWQKVFSHFLSEYKAGRTPNPDILCNKEIKFRAFLNYAKQRGADFIATGHYAKRIDNGHVQLAKALDASKDQSYFLHALSEEQLSQSLFPLADFTKDQVRTIAKDIGLTNHNKKDSTGICFIGERKFKTFLENYLPAKPGDIITIKGEVIGKHDGLMFYTLGQRQGLGIGGLRHSSELPWYVVKKDLDKNLLIVSQDENDLLTKSLVAKQVHWINSPLTFPLRAAAKTRYRQKDQACEIIKEGDDYQVYFDEPQRAVTPGQYVVFYDKNICLGGGIIALP